MHAKRSARARMTSYIAMPSAKATVLACATLVLLTLWAASNNGASYGIGTTNVIVNTYGIISTPSSMLVPFASWSIWNTPIPANPPLNPNNAAITSNWATVDGARGFNVNVYAYTQPIYYIDANTPYTIENLRSQSNFNNNVPVPSVSSIYPNGFVGDPQRDGGAIIYDRIDNLEYDFYHWQYTDGSRIIWRFDATGSGVSSFGTFACSDCGIPLIAGMITADEIQAGVISHALYFASNTPILDGFHVVYPPCGAHDVSHYSGNDVMPYGTRIQLDPNYDISELSRTGQIIAKALQVYGAFFTVQSVSRTLYAQNPVGMATNPWVGTNIQTCMQSIPISAFRILDYGIPGVTGTSMAYP